jgi:hypothetical protein
MGVVCGKCEEQVLVLGKYTYCKCGKKKASQEVLDYVNQR